jgi:hypothetical protein
MPFEPKIPKKHREALKEPWTRFGEIVGSVSEALAAKPADHVLVIEALDGTRIGLVDAADIARKFNAITWALTTKTESNGGVGAVASKFKKSGKLSSWKSGSATFHVDGFKGYAALGDEGLHYLALHETSHVTLLGLKVQDACWTSHKKAGGKSKAYPNSERWTFNEQVANAIAISVAEWLGAPMLEAPTFGRPPALLDVGLKIA